MDTDPAALIERIERTKASRLPSPYQRRRLRIAAGMTLKDVGEAVGTARPGTVQSWERGTNPRGERLIRYAELLRSIEEALSG